MTRFLAWLTAALGAIGLSWLAGKRAGAVATENRALQGDLKDMTTAKEVRNETDAKTDAAVDADLRKWMRPD